MIQERPVQPEAVPAVIRTVEAEEKNMGGCVLMVGFFCCCAGRYLVELVKTDRLDRGGIRALCAVLSLHLFVSWLEGW